MLLTQFINTVEMKGGCYLMHVTQFIITVEMLDGCHSMYVTQFITTGWHKLCNISADKACKVLLSIWPHDIT